MQSITLDEADTYFWFVAKPGVGIFYPYANNHILNTLLIWLTTHAFGLSTITMRMPALLGALLYILTCYFLCRSITDRFSLQLPVFICLIYNPLILDFMVAARGYSLADAFLLAAIAIPVWHHVNGGPSLDRCCALASVALGLSFDANFSFAFVDLAVFLAILTWAVRRRGSEPAARIVGLSILPGLFVAFLIAGPLLVRWKREDLFYGARSLGEMSRSLIEGSLYKLSGGGSLRNLMRFLGPLLIPALGILCACQLGVASVDGSFQDVGARWLRRFAAALAFILAFSVLTHWLAFRLDGILLPLSRTGIFLLPLCSLLAAVIAAMPARSMPARWLRRGITTAFIGLAFHFLLCLRLTYFKEYEYDADVKDVYAVLVQLKQKFGVTDVAAHGTYLSSLNFYRVASGKDSFPEFTPVWHDHPFSKTINVLEGTYEKGFIEREGLVVIYQGESTGVVIAVRPDGPIPALRMDGEIILRRRKAAR